MLGSFEEGLRYHFECGQEKIVFCFRVAELLEGKGGGKKGRFQGKANKLSGRSAVVKLLQEYFAGS